MGTIGVKIKIMPLSPEVNLEEIKKQAAKLIEEKEGKNSRFEEEPIAFGLKALMLFFDWPEEKELEELENKIKEIKNVSSAKIVDMRRLL